MNRGFGSWYAELDDKTASDIAEAVNLLENRGVTLPFPHSSAIRGSKYPFRELRLVSKGSAIRIYYIFDSKRRAVLVLGGIQERRRFLQVHDAKSRKTLGELR